MKDYIPIGVDTDPEPTDDIEDCENKGCAFNNSGECIAYGTECYGYIDPDFE